jgi:hypothetical protein
LVDIGKKYSELSMFWFFNLKLEANLSIGILGVLLEPVFKLFKLFFFKFFYKKQENFALFKKTNSNLNLIRLFGY